MHTSKNLLQIIITQFDLFKRSSKAGVFFNWVKLKLKAQDFAVEINHNNQREMRNEWINNSFIEVSIDLKRRNQTRRRRRGGIKRETRRFLEWRKNKE